MDLTLVVKKAKKSDQGIALFMVISAVAVLSILVTEFAYVAQMNQVIAYDGLDQVKAHYLAKSGLKLSLLRLKAYEQIKKTIGNIAGNSGGDAAVSSMIPKQLLDKIWSFPFIYPIPANIPGLGIAEKSILEKFQKESNLEGSFTALIESESSRFNMNSIIEGFSQPSPSPTTSPSAKPTTPKSSPSPSPTFNSELARQTLEDYLTNILKSKIESDDAFSKDYRDFPIKDLMDQLVAWADKKYQRQNPPGRDELPPKKSPFNRVSELHMLPLMNDELYDLFAPSLTVMKTGGINVNTMKESTLKALIPAITEEQSKEFFKYRDSDEEDHLFKNEEDFFKIVGELVFERNPAPLDEFKKKLADSKIRIIIDEEFFKITVQARVNQSTRTIEAWVTLGKEEDLSKKKGKTTPKPQPSEPGNEQTGSPAASNAEESDPGLRISFMRIY